MSQPSSSMFSAPQWVNTFYAKFPLVTLEQQDTVDWKKTTSSVSSPYVLWVHESQDVASHAHSRQWASSVPASLRAQLLFLLRDIPIVSRPWSNESSAPRSKLPTLHNTAQNRLVSADEIRGWLDSSHPLKGNDASLQGMPDQATYDTALATAQLVIVRLLPAYLASSQDTPSDLALLIPEPPALSAGLTTPLPASLTGDDRALNYDDIIHSGMEALEALRSSIGSSWALGATSPTPLDALIASHLYCIFALPASAPLRLKLEECPELGAYVDRVIDYAGRVQDK